MLTQDEYEKMNSLDKNESLVFFLGFELLSSAVMKYSWKKKIPTAFEYSDSVLVNIPLNLECVCTWFV